MYFKFTFLPVLTFLPVTCHISFTSSFRNQTRRSVLSVCKIWAILFCIHLFFGSPLCLIMEKMNERSYFDVVSGSDKFIFAGSTAYLFGVCCNFNMCKRFYLTTGNRMSLRVIGLRVRAAVQKAKSKKLVFLGKMMPVYTPYSKMAANKLFFCLHVN